MHEAQILPTKKKMVKNSYEQQAETCYEALCVYLKPYIEKHGYKPFANSSTRDKLTDFSLVHLIDFASDISDEAIRRLLKNPDCTSYSWFIYLSGGNRVCR